MQKTVIIMIAIIMALSACTSQHEANKHLMAVNWYQNSGEYRALAYQAFNSARQTWDQSAKQNKPHTRRAVITDLDETLLDTSAYSAWRIKNNQPFSKKIWVQWINTYGAQAVPGAVDFVNYVNNHGGTVFYVSNRSDKDFDTTVSNLKELGFSGVTAQTVFLKSGQTDKQSRFKAIKAQGYDIVMYIGDNLNDFDNAAHGQSQNQRQQFVDENRHQFGTRFIVLPNPMYGSWRQAMVPDYAKLSPAQRYQAEKNALRTQPAP